MLNKEKISAIDGLEFEAATIAAEAIREAIKKMERGIEACGVLTHKDAKQSDHAKEYFSQRLMDTQSGIKQLRKLAAEISAQANVAYLKSCVDKEVQP